MRVGKQITEAIILNSNKIKRYYNDLIAKEFVDYKNAVSNKKRLLHNANLELREAKRKKKQRLRKLKKTINYLVKKNLQQSLKKRTI